MHPRTADCHYKVWGGGFRGKAADYSFQDERPYEWVLGEPTARMPVGADQGTLGMREGGWRRLVVPDAYGDTGLRRVNYGPTGRYTGLKAPFVVEPHETAFFDLIMVDGGTGRCDKMLHPVGVSEKDARKLRSMTCSSRFEIY